MAPLKKAKQPDMGAWILGQAAAGNEYFVDMVRRLRAERVTDHDIIDWWHFSDAHRKKTERWYETFRNASCLAEMKRGKSEEQAIDYALRHYPLFASVFKLDAHPRLNGDDRPLPWELEPRVSAWTTAKGLFQHGEFKELFAGQTSVNAAIRAEMQAGRI